MKRSEIASCVASETTVRLANDPPADMRLFVAFDLPDEIRTYLTSLQVQDLSVRWIPPENMHVTLHFLGDVPEDDLPKVIEVLREVEAKGFTTVVTGYTVFPSVRRPRVIVASLASSDELGDLHRKSGAQLSEAGCNVESRPYRPHVTIARVRSASATDVRSYVESLPQPPPDAFRVNDFSLYKSMLTPKGARYDQLMSFSLD